MKNKIAYLLLITLLFCFCGQAGEARKMSVFGVRGFEAHVYVPKNPSPSEMLHLAEGVSYLTEQLERVEELLPEHAWLSLMEDGPRFHIDWCNGRGTSYLGTEEYAGGGTGEIRGHSRWITIRCYKFMANILQGRHSGGELVGDGHIWGNPNIILHELAHSWHDGFVEDGFNNAEIVAAYESALEHYASSNSDGEKYYWATDEREWFAEMSVVYFSGQAWIEPSERSELRAEDIALIERMWGIS